MKRLSAILTFLLSLACFGTAQAAWLGTSWDPGANGFAISYASGNSIATTTCCVGTYSSARSAGAVSTGKHYVEIEFLAGGYSSFGVRLDGSPMGGTQSFPGFTGWGVTSNGQAGNGPGTFQTVTGSIYVGDRIGIAIDLTGAPGSNTGKLWFSVNGSWVGGGDPAAGTLPTFSNLPVGTALYATAGSTAANYNESWRLVTNDFVHGAPLQFAGAVPAPVAGGLFLAGVALLARLRFASPT